LRGGTTNKRLGAEDG